MIPREEAWDWFIPLLLLLLSASLRYKNLISLACPLDLSTTPKKPPSPLKTTQPTDKLKHREETKRRDPGDKGSQICKLMRRYFALIGSCLWSSIVMINISECKLVIIYLMICRLSRNPILLSWLPILILSPTYRDPQDAALRDQVWRLGGTPLVLAGLTVSGHFLVAPRHCPVLSSSSSLSVPGRA